MAIDHVGRNRVTHEASPEGVEEVGANGPSPGHVGRGGGEHAFATARSAGRHTLNRTVWQERALDPAVRAAVKKIDTTHGDTWATPVTVADFRLPPNALREAPTKGATAFDPRNDRPKWGDLPEEKQKWLNFAHDALMAGDADGRKYYEKFDPEVESMETRKLKPQDAYDALLDTVLAGNGAGKSALEDLSGAELASAKQKAKVVGADYRRVLDALLSDPDLEVYKAAWSNTDDTSREGLIALNRATGEVRTLVVNFPP